MKRLNLLVTFASSLFLAAVSPNPTHAQSFDQCFNAQASGDYVKSERCFQALVTRNPTSDNHYYLAQALRKHGVAIGDEKRIQRAVKHYREAVRINKRFAWAWNGLGNVLHVLSWSSDDETDYLKESIEAYQSALKVPDQPGPPCTAHTSAHTNLAGSLNGKGKFSEALVHVKAAIRLDPKYDGSYEVWGDILYKTGSLDLWSGQRDLRVPAQQKLRTAIEKYRRAIQLNPDAAAAYLGVGMSLMSLEQYSEAIPQFKAATQKGAYDLAYVYVRWGEALEALGDLNGAIGKYQTATQVTSLTAKSSIAYAYLNWGEAVVEQARTSNRAEQLKKWSEALNLFQRALNHRDNLKWSEEIGQPSTHAFAWNNMGLIYWQQGKLEEAQQQFSEAIAISPTFKEARSNEKEVYRQVLLRTKQPLALGSTQYLASDSQSLTKRSIVRIISRFWTGRGTEEGTGWVIDRRGNKALIVTNQHVVAQGRDADEIEIELYYGDVPEEVLLPRVTAQIFKRTSDRNDVDLALIEVEFSEPIDDVRELSIASRSTQQEVPISIVGNSNFKWINSSISNISATDLVLTPKLEPGYSGSPVLDTDNQVAGLVYASDRLGNRPFSYAHPANLVIPKLQEWIGKP